MTCGCPMKCLSHSDETIIAVGINGRIQLTIYQQGGQTWMRSNTPGTLRLRNPAATPAMLAAITYADDEYEWKWSSELHALQYLQLKRELDEQKKASTLSRTAQQQRVTNHVVEQYNQRKGLDDA